MALQESLNKFKKQQEMYHTAQTNIKAGLKSTSRSPAPAVKFSSDTERLQHINSIRKAPVGAQIKRVINFLLESKHDLKDKSQLLELIRKFPEGIAVIDLKDSYPSVMDDLLALKVDGEIWLLSNFDSQEDTAYPNDPKVPIKVDDDLKQLFLGIELPRDMIDIEKDLQKNGMKPATNTAERRATAHVHGIINKPKQKKRNNDISNRTKLTNTHLRDLFKKLGS